MVSSLALSCPLFLLLFPCPSRLISSSPTTTSNAKEGRGWKTRRRRATPPSPPLPSITIVYLHREGGKADACARTTHTHTHATSGNPLAQIPPGAKHGARAFPPHQLRPLVDCNVQDKKRGGPTWVLTSTAKPRNHPFFLSFFFFLESDRTTKDRHHSGLPKGPSPAVSCSVFFFFLGVYSPLAGLSSQLPSAGPACLNGWGARVLGLGLPGPADCCWLRRMDG